MPPIPGKKPLAVLTPWQAHKQRWQDCDKCLLRKHRQRVVLARGSIPAQVLLIGEAPGNAEDSLGQPFKGVAGQLLDRIVEEAVPKDVKMCYSNLVCCIPLD